MTTNLMNQEELTEIPLGYEQPQPPTATATGNKKKKKCTLTGRTALDIVIAVVVVVAVCIGAASAAGAFNNNDNNNNNNNDALDTQLVNNNNGEAAAPVANPTASPVAQAPAAPIAGEELDCSFQDEFLVNDDGSLIMRGVINPQENTVTVELEYVGEAWLGFAFSEEPIMVPNTAIIGLPDEDTVEKYFLQSRSLDGVTPLAEEQQTLSGTSISQVDGITTLTFTKPLVEDGEVAVAVGDVRFNWAIGFSNDLNVHALRGSVVAPFAACLVMEGTEAPTAAPPVALPSPTAAPNQAPTNLPTSSPTVGNVLAEASPTDSPVTQSPAAPIAGGELDCSFQDEFLVNDDGSLIMRGVINPQENTVTVELEYIGEAWLGFAFSEEPIMVPNTAIIGLPDEDTVEKYFLQSRSLDGVTPLAEEQQTLTGTSISQVDGITTLTFTKPLVEDGEVAVAVGDVRFNWAVGFSNDLNVHALFGSVVAPFAACLGAEGTEAPTAAPVALPSPTAAPTDAPTNSPTLSPTVGNIASYCFPNCCSRYLFQTGEPKIMRY